MTNEKTFDAIVVGSGISGGWVAKELTERGLRVLMLERGPDVAHGTGYKTEHVPVYDFKYRLLGDKRRYLAEYGVQRGHPFFNESTEHFFVNDRDNPYTTASGKPFTWIRGHQVGGRSLTWGRQSYRMSALNFEENKLDGHGVDWPIRYDDLTPWYDHVERFIGLSGSSLGNPMSPDGIYQPPYPMNTAERDFQSRIQHAFPDRQVTMARTANLTRQLNDDRMPCHYCGPCERGCSAGAYFSTQSSTLPAAKKTGRLTMVPDSIVRKIVVDENAGRATGVEVLNAQSRAVTTYQARMVFLCASALESVRLLMLSATTRQPSGLANSSGLLGRYIMDHHLSDLAIATIPAPQRKHFTGYRPTALHIPRFRNAGKQDSGFLRGYQLNAGASLEDWWRGAAMPGIGADLKNALRRTGNWSLMLAAQGECLPRLDNRVALDPSVRDKWGMPVLHMDVSWGDNDKAMRKEAGDTCVDMLKQAGYKDVVRVPVESIPGAMIHEMGGAAMGRDRKSGVLDRHNRTFDYPNLFVTDGAAMSSSSSANPSLTYMALSARAAAFAADEFKAGRL